MATKKKATSSKAKKSGFGLMNKHVGFGYRGAHPEGTVTGIAKQGKSRDTTMFEVTPRAKDRHPGEKLPVHRRGGNLHVKSK